MIEKRLSHFSLGQICRSGQCFRLRPFISPGQFQNPDFAERAEEGEPWRSYCIVTGGRYLEVRQQGENCIFYCGESEFNDFWKGYFHLDGDYGEYIRRICPEDSYLLQAASLGSGIRILHQDLWEMIVSFLISQQNNIVRIRRCIDNLCERYGEARQTDTGVIYHAFPGPEALAGLKEDALTACNLGYRSKYVVRAARNVAEGTFDLSGIRRLSYEDARQELMKLYGVGEKVADCICLFALQHFQAFPVDTHIRQALLKHYPDGFPGCYRDIQGILQQYIFYDTLWNGC